MANGINILIPIIAVVIALVIAVPVAVSYTHLRAHET